VVVEVVANILLKEMCEVILPLTMLCKICFCIVVLCIMAKCVDLHVVMEMSLENLREKI